MLTSCVLEELNYRETVKGVRSFMGWHCMPELDSSATSADDSPFAGPRIQQTVKISIKLTTGLQKVGGIKHYPS